jgi:translocation protein SEC62
MIIKSKTGEKLVNFLVEPKKGTKWPSNLPRFETRQDAISVCKELCKRQFLLRSEKRGKGELGVRVYFFLQWGLILLHGGEFLKIHLELPLIFFFFQISRVRDFDETGYFTWLYEGDKTMSHIMSAALIIGFLFCVCFPIWPQFLRIFVWYMSVTLLLFVFLLITSRAGLFLFVWMIGYECWFLPNLFDETLGFVDSFKPLYSFEPTKPGQLPYRIGVAIAFFSFCYWAVTQPSEFDGFVAAQGDFLKDLYAGTLLSDMSQADKENIDKPKMQSLDDLLKSLDEEDEKVDILGDDLDDEAKLDSLLDKMVDDEEDVHDAEE